MSNELWPWIWERVDSLFALAVSAVTWFWHLFFLTYSVLVARASFVSLLLVAAAVSWWAEEVPEWISQNDCRILFQHWMYSRFRKYSEPFAFCTLYCAVDLVLNWWNLQFLPINLHLVSHNDKLFLQHLANLLKAEFLIYKSFQTLFCGTPNWGQVHPVCFKYPSDVSRMWCESTLYPLCINLYYLVCFLCNIFLFICRSISKASSLYKLYVSANVIC